MPLGGQICYQFCNWFFPLLHWDCISAEIEVVFYAKWRELMFDILWGFGQVSHILWIFCIRTAATLPLYLYLYYELYALSSIFIHFHPFPPIFIHFHPLSSRGFCLDLFQITIEYFWTLKPKSGTELLSQKGQMGWIGGHCRWLPVRRITNCESWTDSRIVKFELSIES